MVNVKNTEQTVAAQNESGTVLSRRSLGLLAAGLGATAVAQGTPAFTASASDNLPEGYEGNIAVCTTLIIRAEHEAAADGVWDLHKAWLKKTHGPWGMVTYTVAKNTEFEDGLNPHATKTTGRIIYVIHEVYRHLEGLKKHYAESGDGGYVDEFLRICLAEGSEFHVLQGAPVTHSLLPQDLDFPIQL